jgi:hypothetical protein
MVGVVDGVESIMTMITMTMITISYEDGDDEE